MLLFFYSNDQPKAADFSVVASCDASDVVTLVYQTFTVVVKLWTSTCESRDAEPLIYSEALAPRLRPIICGSIFGIKIIRPVY